MTLSICSGEESTVKDSGDDSGQVMIRERELMAQGLRRGKMRRSQGQVEGFIWDRRRTLYPKMEA